MNADCLHVLYNCRMSLHRCSTRRRHLVHWIVLLSLVLGQFAIGLGYSVAAERGANGMRMPVCTSTGIQYVIWTPDGVTIDAESTERQSSGTCTLCTVSPTQFRFDVQDGYLAKSIAHLDVPSGAIAPLCGSTFVLNPLAAPRAPPSV